MRAYLSTLPQHLLISLLFGFLMASSHYTLAEEVEASSEPKITIRHEKDKTFYEYRVNGILQEIKVVPSVGPAYYLVPADGNTWIREGHTQLLVPSWVLFKW